MIGLAIVGVVIGGVVFMHTESRPSYQPLFTNLQASDSGAVTAQLTTAKIPYQLSNGGATILVPAADVDQERVALAEQGLPSSGTVGFSNLEKSGITTSEFVQQVEYRGLEAFAIDMRAGKRALVEQDFLNVSRQGILVPNAEMKGLVAPEEQPFQVER